MIALTIMIALLFLTIYITTIGEKKEADELLRWAASFEHEEEETEEE